MKCKVAGETASGGQGIGVSMELWVAGKIECDVSEFRRAYKDLGFSTYPARKEAKVGGVSQLASSGMGTGTGEKERSRAATIDFKKASFG